MLNSSGQDNYNDRIEPGMLLFFISDRLKDEPKISKHIVEVSHGQAFVDWADSWAWMFSGNYLYKVHRNIAVGGGQDYSLTGREYIPLCH